jgi:hypothetical protein
MKNQFKLLSILMLVTAASTAQDTRALAGDTNIDVKAIIGVQTCLGGGSCNQTQTLNAIGAPFSVDVKTASFRDLGTVTFSTEKKLQVPTKIGERTLYSFTTEKGKKVYLGLEMKPSPGPGKRYYAIKDSQGRSLIAGKDFNIVELYRYNEAKNEWLRNDIIFVELNSATEVPLILSADGNILVGQISKAE